MLIIQKKLINGITNKCFGVICSLEDGVTMVCLSINKAIELNVQDIEILEYLDCDFDIAFENKRRTGYFALGSNEKGYLNEYSDIPYERIGDLSDIFNMKEIVYGHMFDYKDFLELDNDFAIKRALLDLEKVV